MMGDPPAKARSLSMREHDGPGFDGDPDRSPWPVLALGVALTLVCLILIARLALTIIAG
jgi:hypothetical protein